MSSKSQQDALNELGILALNQEVNADATGVASPNIDSLLQDMSNKARAKRYEEVGSIYDIPYEITCTYPTKNPRYLCYFVWGELDLSTLADEFEFD